MNNETKNRGYRILIWLVVSLVFIGIGFLCFRIHQNDPKNDYIMSLIGSLCSLLGLLIAVIQIVKSTKASIASKEAAENAKEAVNNNLKELNKYFSYSTLTQCERLIDEIETLIHSKNLERLFVRLKELKDQLIDIQKNPKLDKQIQNCDQDLNKSIILIQTDIDAVGKKISDGRSSLDLNVVFSHVETMKTDLTKMACELKYEKL